MKHCLRLSCLLMAPAIVAAPSCDAPNRNANEDIAALSRELMVELPKGTRVLGVERQHGLDDMTRAKIELGRNEFEPLLLRLPMARDTFSKGKSRLGADSGFWNPGATPGIRYAQSPLPEGRALHVGYAANSPGTVVIFIVNHGT